MTTNPTNTSSGMPSAPELKEQSYKGLREFFQQKSIRNLVSVLVPSALAAILFPVFGPAVAGGAAAVTIVPEVKEAAMMNPKIDAAWLGASLEASLKDQGWIMGKIAPQFHDFIQLDLAALEVERNRLLA